MLTYPDGIWYFSMPHTRNITRGVGGKGMERWYVDAKMLTHVLPVNTPALKLFRTLLFWYLKLFSTYIMQVIINLTK